MESESTSKILEPSLPPWTGGNLQEIGKLLGVQTTLRASWAPNTEHFEWSRHITVVARFSFKVLCTPADRIWKHVKNVGTLIWQVQEEISKKLVGSSVYEQLSY